MVIAPFRIAPSRRVQVEVALEPVYNTLASLSFLNVATELKGLDPWLVQAAAGLTPEERRRNRLVFEGLGVALLPERDWPDLPGYLDDLAAQEPAALRDRMLERLCRESPARAKPGAVTPAVDPAHLLADPQAFLAHLERLYPDDPPDRELQLEVHALLNDPLAMQGLIVLHLRALWEGLLAAEWQHRLPLLRWLVYRLRKREWPAATAGEAVRAFIGHDVPAAIGAQLDGVQRVIFVLSPHIGPWASRFGSSDTIRIFVRGRPEDLPLRQDPIKRVELIGPLAALADETRLRILGLLAQHEEFLAQEIIAQLGLSQSSVSRHLKQLTGTGFLVERRGEGANKSYSLNPARVDWTFRSLQQFLAEGEPLAMPDARDDLPREFRRLLDADGRVVRWPAKRKEQILVLNYLAPRFAPERRYSETEVNALLNEWHTFNDPAILRRSLYDEGLLARTQDGAQYWRPAETLQME